MPPNLSVRKLLSIQQFDNIPLINLLTTILPNGKTFAYQPTFQERKRTRVFCKECGDTMNASSLQHHTERACVRLFPQMWDVDVGGGGLEVYKVSFPRILKSVDSLVEVYPAKPKNLVRLREHFMFSHWKSKLAILQEVPELLPWCYKCGMHLQAARLFKYRKLDNCHNSTERRLWRRDVERAARCGEMEFNLYGEEVNERVENLQTFRYLGQPLYQTYDDWPDVQQNIMRTRSVRVSLGTLRLREGADPKVLASFYRAVVQVNLLYGSEMWVLLASMEKRI